MDKNFEAVFGFQNYLENTALITKDEQITYNQLQREFEKIASYLSSNSLVFLLSNNDIESVASYLAILKADASCALINTNNEKQLFKLVTEYKPKYIILPQKQTTLFQNWDTLYSFREYVILKSNENINYPINPELSLLLTTSGSTGSPKFVRLSFKNIKSNTISICEYLNIQNTDRVITTLPFYYSYGLSLINTHLHKGASIVLTNESIVSKEFWELFKEYKINTFAGVPYTYEMLKKLRFEKMDLSQLRYITQAGGKLNHKLVSDFHTIATTQNFDFFVMYGQTEATARMSYLPLEHIKNHSNSIGIAIPYGRFKLIDDDKNEITQENVSGELVYEGDNVSLGYATSHNDLALEDENNSILHTGDLALYDENKLFYIVGRKKRFCKVFGNRINLDEIEQLVKSHGFEAVCIGEDDKIYIFSEKEIDSKSLIKLLSTETALHRSAFSVKQIKTIPRNESGKIQYSKLENMKDSI